MSGVRVYRAADGVWIARIYLGLSETGKQVRPSKRFPKATSREEALRLAEEWAESVRAGKYGRHERIRDLLDVYIDDSEIMGLSPNTVKQYRMIKRNYVDRFLPRSTLASIDVKQLNRFMGDLVRRKEKGGAGVSHGTALAVYSFLRAAFNRFVDEGLISANPMLYVSKPSPRRYVAQIIDEWDYPRLKAELDVRTAGISDEDGFEDGVFAYAALVSLFTGMRVGEVCALRRRDVSRARRLISVSGTVIEEKARAPYRRDVTKGRRARNVSIDDGLVAMIGDLMRAQDARIKRLDHDSPLITTDGSFMRPSDVSKAFLSACRKLELPRGTTFHSLRHTHASWLLADGCDIKTLSERLGHASVSTTLNIYSHLMPGRDEAAAQAFAETASRLEAANDRTV